MKINHNFKRSKSNASLIINENVSIYNQSKKLKILQYKCKRINYPKKIITRKIKVKRNPQAISKDKNDTSREFGIEISNVDKNKKEIRYPKPNKIKENTNNIAIYPKTDIDNKNKKKYPTRKENKPNKSKIKILIKKINKFSINQNIEEIDNNNINIIYNENPIKEYEEDIINFLFKEEIKNRANYTLFPNITDKTDDIQLSYLKRFSFINLFISFQNALILRQETLYLTINIFDRYIQKITIDNKLKQDLNKIAITCLFIASKNEEIYAPYLKEFLDIFNKKYEKRDILLKEYEILSSLDFQIITISPLLFLNIFCQSNGECENKEIKKEMDLCFHCAQFFVELCLIEPKFCELKPSLQAAICLYMARKLLLCDYGNNYNKAWTFDLTFKTNYSEIQIKKYIKIVIYTIKNFFRNVYTRNFMAMPLYIKYITLEYSEISSKLKNIFIGEINDKIIKEE